MSLNDFAGQNLFSSLLKRTLESKDSEGIGYLRNIFNFTLA